MIIVLIFAFVVGAVATFGVVASAHRHGRWSADHELSGPQKMHQRAVPRIGGVGILAGFLGGLAALSLAGGQDAPAAFTLAACAMPACALGLIEDFTKCVSPRRRLAAAVVSAALAYWQLDVTVPGTGWTAIDGFLESGLVLFAVTVVVVAGVVNAVNIIDGMNGLASMSVVMGMAALAYIAGQVGDRLVLVIALSTLGATVGFFLWNYPRGLVFLGDGGAYLLGFLSAESGLLLINRNPDVSILAPLALVAYPVMETLFTMYRRKLLQGRPMTQPDASHLHTLIYRRLMRWAVGPADAHTLVRGNSRTSPVLWLLSSLAVVPTAIWWDDTPALCLTLVVFVFAYLYVYWQIVRFKTPRWLLRGAGR